MSNPANPLEFYNFLREIDRNMSVPNAYDRMFGPYSALFRAARMNKSIHDYAQRVDQYNTIEKLAQENEALRAQSNNGQSNTSNSSTNALSEPWYKNKRAHATKEEEQQRVRDRIDAARSEKGKAGSSSATAEEDSDEYVTFTLPRANDPEYGGFAQKILDLGIATDNGLWGADGDVAFYTKQLYDQDALDANGNLKIGVPIRLRKRK